MPYIIYVPYTSILTCTQYDFGATGDNAYKTCQPFVTLKSQNHLFSATLMTYSVCIGRCRYIVCVLLFLVICRPTIFQTINSFSKTDYGAVSVGFSIGINWRRVISCGFLKTNAVCYTRCRKIRIVFHLKHAFHRTLPKILIRKFVPYLINVKKKVHTFLLYSFF